MHLRMESKSEAKLAMQNVQMSYMACLMIQPIYPSDTDLRRATGGKLPFFKKSFNMFQIKFS